MKNLILIVAGCLASGSALAQPACTSTAPNSVACQAAAVNLQPGDIVLGQEAVGPSRPNESVKVPLGTSGMAIPLLSWANIWGGAQTFSGNVTVGGTLGVAGATTFSGGLVGTLMGHASLDLPLTGGVITGDATVGGTLGVTGVASLTALSGSQTGVFTNTQMNDPFAVLLNGISPLTEWQTDQGGIGNGYFATSALTVGAAVPSTSTVYGANGVASYVTNQSSATNAVAGYFSARATATGAKIWGLNPIVNDGGFSTNALGIEADIVLTNAATVATGVNVTGSFGSTDHTGSPAYATYAAGAGRWGIAFISFDGGAVNGLWLGSQTKVANSDSQPALFWAHDNSNTAQACSIQATHQSAGADMQLICAAGSIVLNSAAKAISLTFPSLPTGTPATYACFTSGGALISSATAC